MSLLTASPKYAIFFRFLAYPLSELIFEGTNFLNFVVFVQNVKLTVGVLRVFSPGGLLRGGVVPPAPWDLGFCFVAGAEILTTSSER